MNRPEPHCPLGGALGPRRRNAGAALALALTVLSTSTGWAQTAPLCETASPMSPTRLLRRLSLDLRGRAPSFAELQSARADNEVPAGTIDAWLASPGFLEVMRSHHASLLWPNLDQVQLIPQTHILYPYPRASGTVYMSPVRSVYYRAAGPGNLYEPCADKPAAFDADGQLVFEPVLVGTTTVAWVEGWVEVQPYWDPSSTIRVCALDAIESRQAPACPGPAERYPFLEPSCQSLNNTARSVGLGFRGDNIDCDGPLSIYAPGCGCGSDLRRCATVETLQTLRRSFNDQALRIVERVIEAGRPYHEVLTDRRLDVNGPIAHFMRHQARLNFELFAEPDPTAPMGSVNKAFTDGTWQTIERRGRHSGVLTAPAYLMRHAAWRQRAHRFYAAFECSTFAPSGPLPSPFAPCSQHEDLTKRCGCNDCHLTLEPMAAHWGRFAEFGFMNLEEETFPSFGAQTPCSAPFQDIEQIFWCIRLYEIDPVGDEVPYRGYLNAYVFRNPAEHVNIEQGPARLVDASLQSGRFAACAAERMWTRFMHRPPTPDERAEVLPPLTQRFVDGGYDLRGLVRDIVEQPAYGRAP